MIDVNEIVEKLKALVKSKSHMLPKLNLFMSKDKPPASAAPVPRPPSRPMKFPYTFSAKIAQFPYKFYFQNSTIFRYYCYGVIASVPVFMYISGLSNSPANKKKWAEIRRKEHEELAHRFD